MHTFFHWNIHSQQQQEAGIQGFIKYAYNNNNNNNNCPKQVGVG
jgi:hypothetical protein